MDKKDLMGRMKNFALRIINLSRALPNNYEAVIIKKQILRCSTSVAANYRAALRARSKSEFLAKLGIVEEEADETIFWLEIIIESNLLKERLVASLLKEANELLAITIATQKATRRNMSK